MADVQNFTQAADKPGEGAAVVFLIFLSSFAVLELILWRESRKQKQPQAAVAPEAMAVTPLAAPAETTGAVVALAEAVNALGRGQTPDSMPESQTTEEVTETVAARVPRDW